MNTDIAGKIDGFFAAYPVRKYARGQVLVLSGDEPDKVYQLLSGTVKQYDVTYRGDEIVLNRFRPPAFFPMSFALNGGVSQYIFEAETAIELRTCPSAAVVEFLRANPDVLLDLLSRVYRGTDALLERMAQLMSGSALSRLCLELVIEARRAGTTEDKVSYTLHVSEKDLAARAGLTRETVSREIRKLKDQTLLEVGDGEIHISDLEAIQQKYRS